MRKIALSLIVMMAAGSALYAFDWPEINERHSGGSSGSFVLERIETPVFEGRMTIIPEDRFDENGKSSITELSFAGQFAFFHDILGGDAEIGSTFELTVFSDETELDLPSSLLRFSCDIEYVLPWSDDLEFSLAFSPGIYSDIDEFGSGMFALPFYTGARMAIDRDMAAYFGLRIRPGYESAVIPVFGVMGDFNDQISYDLGIPFGIIVYYASPDVSFETGYSWKNESYNVSDSEDVERDIITVEDVRFWAGATYRICGTSELTARIGRVVFRNVEFGDAAEGMESSSDIDRTTYFEVGIRGPF